MAERRTVSVGLIANVTNYVANMDRAAAATRKTAAAAVGSEKQLRAQAEVYGKVGTAAMAGGAIAAAGLAVVIKATADYGSKMAQLQSLSKASAADMKRLSAAAMEQGKAYGYSASQVADAEIELTKAGFSTSKILGGGLKAALSLAAAGQMDVSEATSITTIALTQFQLQAKDLPHVADLLAAGADKALGGVSELGQALSNGGSQAAAMGLSIQDTVGVLSAFANAGIIGAEAGTQLRSMFLQLQNPSAKAKKTLDEYGISVYDQQGKFVGLTNLAGQLQTKLGGLSAAQQNAAKATIFGSYAVNGANVLIREGAKGIAEWTSKVNEYGFANAQAAGKMNSLSGDVQKLSASFDTNLIKAGTGANDALRGIVQTGEHLLDIVGSIPAPVLSAGVALTTVAAGATLLGGAALVAVPRVKTFQKTMADANVSGKRLAGTVGKGGALLLGITALGAGLANLSTEGTASTSQLALAADQLRSKWRNVDQLFPKAGLGGLVAGTGGPAGLKAALDQLNGDWWQQGLRGVAQFADNVTGLTGVGTHFGDVYKSNAQTLDAFGQQLSGMAAQDLGAAQSSFRALNAQAGGTSQTAKRLLDQMPTWKSALGELAQKAGVAGSQQDLLSIATGRGASAAKVAAYQQREAAASAKEQASALRILAGGADDGTTSIKALSEAIKELDHGQLSAREAARGFQQAIDDASTAAKKNGRNLDISTQAGRDNQSALDGIASAAQQAAQAQLDAGGGAADAAKAIRDGRKAYIDAAVQMGLSKTAARKLADALFDIPKNVSTKVGVDGVADAMARLRDLKAEVASVNGLRATIAVNVAASGVDALNAQNYTRRAAGGSIDGPGPKGVDSVRAMLAPGEHVLTAGDVDAMGGQDAVYQFRAELHMAKGGAVKKSKKPSNAIAEATAAAAKAQTDADRLQKRVIAAKKTAAAREKAADKAQKAYENIDGTKKNRSAKKAAKARADAAKKRADAASKQVDTLRDDRDKARQKHDDAISSQGQLRDDREDFVSTQRRATDDNPIDPLSYVDQLRQMSRDDNFSDARRKTFKDAANKYEREIVNLAKKSADAAAKLTDLKQSSEQLASSVTSSVAGRYGISNAGSQQQVSGWTVRNGIRFQTTSSAVTAASIDSYYGGGAKDTDTFASQLEQLRGRGVDPRLLAEIAQDANGPQLAAALLSGTKGQIASINRNYSRIQSSSQAAGQTVADANYKALITSAQANADQITKQLSSDSERLRKLIASAFGLKGYAVGTPAATPGLHLVGEQGPELLRFAGGEQVYTAGQTRTYLRGGGAAARSGQTATRLEVRMPTEMNLIDASGAVIGRVRAEARDVATQVVNAEAHAVAVQLQG